MKNKLLLCALLTIMSGAVSIKAQNWDLLKEKIHSPQVADMMRFDKFGGVSKTSGRMDLSIELTKIQDNDFYFPVTLNYNSAGFMPSKPESYVGLNWSINAGGAIVREVKGIPDDLQARREFTAGWAISAGGGIPLPFPGQAMVLGFNYFVQNKGMFNKDIGIDGVSIGGYMPFAVAKSATLLASESQSMGHYVEASSDIYHFNFGQHSGKFMINFDGTASVIASNGGKYKVDLSSYKYSDFDNGILNSTIRIITDDGYIYSFGGSFDNVEYSYSWCNSDASYPIRPGIPLMVNVNYWEHLPSVSSYHLYKVEAPNGRILTIEYKSADRKIHTWRTTGSTVYSDFSAYLWRAYQTRQQPIPVDDPLRAHRQNFICSWHPSYNSVRYYTMALSMDFIEERAPTHNLTKVALIEKIHTDSEDITFAYRDSQYSPLDNIEDSDWYLQFEKYAGAELDYVAKSVRVGDNNIITSSTTSFYYTPWQSLPVLGKVGSRRMLDRAKSSESGEYKFSYNIGYNRELPSPLTENIDFWNNWRGSVASSNISLIPKYYIWADEELFYGDDGIEDRVTSRSPSDQGVDLGMLRQVTFPTGGTMDITYESNEYAKYVKRTAASNFMPVLVDNTIGRKAGGLRVKSITRDGITTSYLYRNNLNDPTSSGILLYEPLYITRENMDFSWEHFATKVQDTGFDTRAYQEDHVMYSTVIEIPNTSIVSTNNPVETPDGYIVEKFIDYIDESDPVFISVKERDISSEISTPNTFRNGYYNSFLHATDKSYLRGKPKSVEVYNSVNKLMRRDLLTYHQPRVFETAYYYNPFFRVFLTAPPYRDFKDYIEKVQYVQRVPVELAYSPLASQITTDFFYDATGRETNRVEQVETYEYGEDLSYMKQKTVENSDGSILQEDYIYSYELDSEPYQTMRNHNFMNYLIQKDVRRDDLLLFRQNNNYTLKTSLPLLSSQEKITEGVIDTLVKVLQHDRLGNKVEVVVGDSHVFYLWSYGGRYAIAEVLGIADFDTFETAVRESFGMGINEVAQLWPINPDALEALRTHSLMRTALVTTMLYEPSVGIKELTDPTGRTRYFEYDTSNRLSGVYRIENGEQVMESSYQYHVINQ